MTKKEIFILIGIAILFIALHIPALHQPYHQDEYKWPIIVNPALTEPGGIPHPPVGEFIYRQAGFLIGYDNFRYVPFFFGILNLFLLFYLVKIIFNTKTALWSVGLFALSFYSLLATLMVDTDGSIMPFFFLIMSIAYYKMRAVDFKSLLHNPKNIKWFGLLLVSAALGFFVKASFVVGVAALAIDFAIEKGALKDRRRLLRYIGFGFVGALIFALLLVLAKFIFPYFRLEWTIKYWTNFVKFGGRGWFQSFIQFIKAVLYLSPVLVLVPLFSDKEVFIKARSFFAFILIGLFFYLIAFDFSTGALDRYFQFLIVPLCVISAAIIAKNLDHKPNIINYVAPLLLSFAIFSLQFFNHYVPPLHPKGEWVNRILSFRWDFLYPFSGGSGPLGFYVSFALMALFWIFSFIVVSSFFFRRDFKKEALLAIIIVGIFYNVVFFEEYLFGKINGFAPALVRDAAVFIQNNQDIKKVIVYNDNGGDEIRKTGKYEKRLYTSPQFDLNQKVEAINSFSGHYLEINVPPIDPNSIYRRYLDLCRVVYEKKDKKMQSKIYDCRSAPNLHF